MNIFNFTPSFLYKKSLPGLLFFVVLISLVFLPALNAHASFLSGFKDAFEIGDNAGLSKTENPIKIITRSADLILALIATIALFAIIWGGVMYILALGEEARATKAKRILLYAIIGLTIASLAKMIVSVVICTVLKPTGESAFNILYDNFPLCTKVAASEFVEIIIRIIQFLMAPAAAIAFGALVYGGYMYIISGPSGGDEKKVSKAKQIIIYAFIGLAIIGISGIIVNVVLNLVIPPAAAGG